MATLTVQTTDRSANGFRLGSDLVAADAGLADEFANTGKELLVVKNAGGSPCVIDLVTPGTVDGEAIPDKQVTVAAGDEAIYGPFPRSWYTNSGTKMMNITYDQVSSVTVGVIKIGS